MKTNVNSPTNLLVTFATAAVVAVGVLASGQSLDPAVLLSIFFTAGVAGWTFADYRHAPEPLLVAAPVPRLIPGSSSASTECRVLPQAA